MSQVFVAGTANMAFSGELLFAMDGASLGAVFGFGAQRVDFVKDSHVAYPDLIDGQSYTINKVEGVKLGQLQLTGVVQSDRGWNTFINLAFGARTGSANGPASGQLYPWLMNIVPYSGAGIVGATGLWWNALKIHSQFATAGGRQMTAFTLTGIVLDPDNVEGAPSLTAPSYVGTAGHGIAPFSRTSFTNDSSTTYDQVRSFSLSLSNGLQIVPAMKDVANRIASGCVPGPIKGSLEVSQLRGAVNATPVADGVYPIDVVLPTGDGAHALTIAGSWSYDRQSQGFAPTEFNDVAATYALFGTSAGATTTAGWPVTASYA